MKKIIGILALIIVTMLFLVACDNNNNNTNYDNNIEIGNQNNNIDDYIEIDFSKMYEDDGESKHVSSTYQNLNGKKVKLNGYPALLTPVDESFIYLNKNPYVTSPFATIGEDKTKLEVVSVFMADNSVIHYTENPITVYGTLDVSEKKNADGYTTQVRIYADKIENIAITEDVKKVNNYYLELSSTGAIYNLQNLQMNIEYISNPKYMSDYGNTKSEIVSGIVNEYIGMDSEYINNFGVNNDYVGYYTNSLKIIENGVIEDNKLNSLNKEFIAIFKEQISVLKKYKDIAYSNENKELSEIEAEQVYNELIALNKDNLELYNRFTTWKNKLNEI